MFHLDLAPAFGKSAVLLLPCKWSDKIEGTQHTIEDYAKKAFRNKEAFFLVLQSSSSKTSGPIPLQAYISKRDLRVDCIALYVFCSTGTRQPFRFQMALPGSIKTKTALHVLMKMDQGEWVSPEKLFYLMKYMPKTSYWQHHIADYCFMVYGPEMPEWNQIIDQVLAFKKESLTPRHNPALEVFHALRKQNAFEEFLKCGVITIEQGASIYVYYSLFGSWKRNPAIEEFLRKCFMLGQRHLTQVFCLAALSTITPGESTRRYLRSYSKHAPDKLDIEEILDPVKTLAAKAQYCQNPPENLDAIAEAKLNLLRSDLMRFAKKTDEARELRTSAKRMALESITKNPQDASSLEMRGLLLQNSPLRQNQALAQHYLTRARSQSETIPSCKSKSPRGASFSPSLQVSHNASPRSRTPR